MGALLPEYRAGPQYPKILTDVIRSRGMRDRDLLRKTSRTQCCGSRMFIPDPGSRFLPIPDPGSRISDPKTATKERGEEKNLSYLTCSHKFHKIVNYFGFEVLKKKI